MGHSFHPIYWLIPRPSTSAWLRPSSLITVVFLLVLSFDKAHGQNTGFQVQAVLTTEDPIPGDNNTSAKWNDDNPESVFSSPVLNDRGDSVVLASARKIQPFQMIIRMNGAVAQRIAQDGDAIDGTRPIPDPSGQDIHEELGLVDHILLNAEGHVAFRGYALTPAGAGDSAWWLANDQGLRMIMRIGDPAPGFTGHYENIGPRPSLAWGSAGRMALTCGIVGTDLPLRGFSTFWTGKIGTLSPLFRWNEPAPGTTSTFGAADAASRISMTRNGNVLVIAQMESDLATSNLGNGLWLATPNDLLPLLLPHSPLAELGAGVSVGLASQFGFSDVNSRGDFVTVCSLEGPGVTPRTRSCLIAGTPDGRRILGRSGEAVTSVPGSSYTQFTRPIVNSTGRIVVSANVAPLQGDEFTALMVDRGNGLEMVFRSLAIAPGFGSEFIVTQFGSRRFINSTGQILIGTKVKGPGTSESGQDVLYLIETDFTVRRVAWAGMTVTLANGESVVLEKIAGTPSTFPSVIPAGDDDGQPTMLNNLGEFAFIGLWQGDGKVRSGVFVAHKAVQTSELTLKLAYDPQGSWKLLFPTLSGQTYYLQSRNAVDHGVWENFGASLLGDGQTALIPLPIEPGRDGKFFRVATTP